MEGYSAEEEAIRIFRWELISARNGAKVKVIHRTTNAKELTAAQAEVDRIYKTIQSMLGSLPHISQRNRDAILLN